MDDQANHSRVNMFRYASVQDECVDAALQQFVNNSLHIHKPCHWTYCDAMIHGNYDGSVVIAENSS
jgi:hypothetical protein